MGSPPPVGSKKEVLKFRSVSNIVIAPASTGRERSSKIAVTKTDHTNNGVLSKDMRGVRMLAIVLMKLMAPRIDETPAKCRLKMVISTALWEWNLMEARGGYTVHPVPAPTPDKEEVIKSKIEGGRSQNLMLFIRGNAMSCAPIIRGTSQLPNPPIMIGITVKKIITKACDVTIVL